MHLGKHYPSRVSDGKLVLSKEINKKFCWTWGPDISSHVWCCFLALLIVSYITSKYHVTGEFSRLRVSHILVFYLTFYSLHTPEKHQTGLHIFVPLRVCLCGRGRGHTKRHKYYTWSANIFTTESKNTQGDRKVLPKKKRWLERKAHYIVVLLTYGTAMWYTGTFCC